MRVLLFDIDGTLLNSGGAGQAAMEDALESAFGVTRQTEGIPVAGRTDRAITSDMMQFHDIPLTEENSGRLYAHYLQHLPKRLGTRGGLVLPGVETLLAQLAAEADCLLGLLTGNFKRGAEIKLSHFELAHHFRCGGYGDHHHDRDDVAREAKSEALRTLGRDEHDDVWVIGDTPNDVKCGRAIGARVVAVATGHFSDDELKATCPDFLFRDFADVAAVTDVLRVSSK